MNRRLLCASRRRGRRHGGSSGVTDARLVGNSGTIRLAAHTLNGNALRREHFVLQREHARCRLVDAADERDRALQDRLEALPVLDARRGIVLDDQVRIRDVELQQFRRRSSTFSIALKAELGMGILFITHDLGVVAEMADDVVVMRHGRESRSGPLEDIFADPPDGLHAGAAGRHAAPRAARRRSIGSILDHAMVSRSGPCCRLPTSGAISAAARILDADDQGRRRCLLPVRVGETLGLVGESGCGKSTTGRMIVGLDDPLPGRSCFGAGSCRLVARRDGGAERRDLQIVFQNPQSALDPRLTIRPADPRTARPARYRDRRPSGMPMSRASWRRCPSRRRTGRPLSPPDQRRTGSTRGHRARARLNPSLSSATSPFRRLTCRFRPRS